MIGVIRTEQRFPDGVDLWIARTKGVSPSLGASPSGITPQMAFGLIGRLQPGLTISQARSEMNTLFARLKSQYAGKSRVRFGSGVGVQQLSDRLISPYRVSLVSVGSLALLILVIAFTNAASLMLLESAHGQKDFAIRQALGCSQSRLLFVTIRGSVIRAVAGAIIGLGVAYLLLVLARSTIGALVPRLNMTSLNWRVVTFSILLGLLTGMLSTVAPALFLLRSDLNLILSGNLRQAHGGFLLLARRSLLAGQIAAALVLLTGAILSLRTFQNMRRVELGFDEERAFSAQIALPKRIYPTVQHVARFQQEWLNAIKANPEITAVGLVNSLPLKGDSGARLSMMKANVPTMVTYTLVGGSYFHAMGIALLEGRTLGERDAPGAAPILVMNRTLAKRLWGGSSPVGDQILIEGETSMRNVVGVVGDVRASLEAEAEPEIYLPFAQPFRGQLPATVDMVLVVKTASRALDLATLRAQLATVDKNAPLFRTESLTEIVFRNLVPARLRMEILTLVGLSAFGLALLGIYGTVSYSSLVKQRDLAVRLALGAQARDIHRGVIGEALGIAVAGTVPGLVVSFWLTKIFSALWYNVKQTDWSTYAIAALLFMAGAVLASLIPAIKASRIDPAQVLRSE